MENICMVMDVDGFHVCGEFRVRELAYYALTTENRGNFRFDLRDVVPLMGERDWKTAMYAKRKIHGLSLRPLPGEHTFRSSDLPAIVTFNYRNNLTSDRYLVAYKGGTVERDILDLLDIPSVDLEDFGCPRFDRLTDTVLDERDCGHHDVVEDWKTAHCPRVECLAFVRWIRG